MIFDFIIIPVDKSFINVAFYIRYRLEEINYFSQIIIDKKYDDSFSSRVNNCREKNYNIITINEDYNEAQTINVIFQHTDFKVETMPLRDFLNLVSDYKNDDNCDEHFGLNCVIT
jgi:hypothetical protein